jgi:hypothetical protein
VLPLTSTQLDLLSPSAQLGWNSPQVFSRTTPAKCHVSPTPGPSWLAACWNWFANRRPDAGAERNRRGATPPPPVLPHPDVQSPGVDVTVIADVTCWCSALMSNPLALRAEAEVPLQTPLPLWSAHANSWKFYVKYGAVLLTALLKRETRSLQSGIMALPRGAESYSLGIQIYTKFRTNAWTKWRVQVRRCLRLTTFEFHDSLLPHKTMVQMKFSKTGQSMSMRL